MHLRVDCDGARRGAAGLLLAMLLLGGGHSARPALADDPPAQPAEPTARTLDLIGQLGDADFAVREQARRELAGLGIAAYDALIAAQEHDDLEVASQARFLAQQIRARWMREGAPAEVRQILKDYELQADAARQTAMQQLAALPDHAGVEWLCRLVFLESSPVLARHAALQIITRAPGPSGTAWERQAQSIARNLGRSQRAAAQWLRAHVLAQSDSEQGLAEWARLTAAEQQVLDGRSTTERAQDTTRMFVVQLWRRQIEQLDRLGRPEQALQAVRTMVQLERGDSASLSELVSYLAQRQAWPVVDEVAARFEPQFDADALLLYTLAQARLTHGDEAQANATAARALKINANNPDHHLKMALQLEERGLTRWSDGEYQRVIDLAPVSLDRAMRARLRLAESLHDRLIDGQAAAVLQGAIDAIDKDPNVADVVRSIERDPSSIRSRMHFFYACDFAARGDQAKQLEHLDAGIKADPTDGDVLIALDRVRQPTPERRDDTRRKIRQAVAIMTRAMQSEPDEPNHYNQLAWLVANTGSESGVPIDEAIRASHKSIELRRAQCEQFGISPCNVASLLDTLAHCYFAKGDFALAVKYQTEAVAQEPHMQTISRQLQVFRRALEQHQPPAPAP